MNKNKQVSHCKQETFTNPFAPPKYIPRPVRLEAMSEIQGRRYLSKVVCFS